MFIGYQQTKQFYLGHVQSDFEGGSRKLGIDGKPSLDTSYLNKQTLFNHA